MLSLCPWQMPQYMPCGLESTKGARRKLNERLQRFGRGQMSPSTFVFQAAGVARGSLFSLEFFAPSAQARSASASPFSGLDVQVIARKLMAMFAMSFGPVHGQHRSSGRLDPWRPWFLLKNFFWRTTIFISPNQSIPRDIKFLCPLRQCESFAVERHAQIISTIIRLYLKCCPPAIRRLVIPIWVDAIQRLAVLGQLHIVKKVLEYFPALAKGYASATIMFISGSSRLNAAHSHAAPNCMSPDTGHSRFLIHRPTITQLTGFRQHTI